MTAEFDAARIAINFPQGLRKEKDNNTYGTTVGIHIDVKPVGGSVWFRRHTRTIRWKSLGSAYERSFRVQRPATSNGAWQVRVTRDSATSNGDGAYEGGGRHYNTCRWSRITRIIEDESTYPDSAYVALRIPSSEVGSSIQNVSFDVKGRKIKLPNNYNPVTRNYSGSWNGGFSGKKFSNNPSWIIYDLLTDADNGLGEKIKPGDIDIYSFYDAAVFADQSVSNGINGNEPRYTFNGSIGSIQNSTDLIKSVAASMRASVVSVNGVIKLIHDHPRSTAFNLTLDDVLEDGFSSQSTEVSSIHTEAIVKYKDPNRNFDIATTTIRHNEAFAKYGLVPIVVEIFGCTSESQAQRHGKWLLESDYRRNEMMTWSASFDGILYTVGDVVSITCPWTTNNQPVKFAITAIREGSEPGTYDVSALKYDAQVYAVADNIGNLDTTGGTGYFGGGSSPILTSEQRIVGAVSNVTHRFTANTVQNLGFNEDAILLSWDAPTIGFDDVSGYKIEYTIGQGERVLGNHTFGTSYQLALQGREIYEFTIRAKHIAGNYGPPVVYTVDAREENELSPVDVRPHFNAPSALSLIGQAWIGWWL